MSKGIGTGELNKAINRLEKEASEMAELASALRVIIIAQATKEQLESSNNAIEGKIERNKGYFYEGEEKVKAIELTVASKEEKAEAKIASIKSNTDSRIEDEMTRGDKRIEEIRKGLNKKEQEALGKIAGFDRVTSEAEKAASEAVAKREEAERQYKEFKDKVLV
ncbi:MAG TPA: hypothetical protein ENI23_00355 [bacterium]|nr:hypothetical protein [bacterium]